VGGGGRRPEGPCPGGSRPRPPGQKRAGPAAPPLRTPHTHAQEVVGPSRPPPITQHTNTNTQQTRNTQVVLRPRPRCRRRPSVISSAPAPPRAGSTGVGVVGYWEIHPPPPLPRTSNAVLVVIYALLMHEESSRANSKWDCVSQPTESHRGTRCLPILALPCACGSPVAPASTTPI
jgi:hypothetical protein